MKNWKKVTAAALCLGLVLAPVNPLPGDLHACLTARAADSGTIGENLTWTLDASGTLTISGEGEMTDFLHPVTPPWTDVRDSIQSVVIADGVTGIGASAFYECTNLTSVTIPGSVKSIGISAFFNCTGLTGITIPGVETLGEDVFNGCTGLTSVTLPDSLTDIGERAFKQCTSLTAFSVPANVRSIGRASFYGCTGLREFTVDEASESFTAADGVLFTKDMTRLYRYPSAKEDTAYTVPDGVTKIEQNAFSQSRNLTAVTIPDSVTGIGNYAFYSCKPLTTVRLPEGLTNVGEGVFQFCENLTDISIPDTVVRIGYWAFEGCTSLTEIKLPSNLKEIGGGAFTDCKSLTSVTILNPECKIYDDYEENGVFTNSGREFTGTIYGYENSTAQAFAEKYGCKFEVIGSSMLDKPVEPMVAPYSKGEPSGDGIINAKDATMVLIAAAKAGTGGETGLTPEMLAAADVNGDGNINAIDATAILRYAAAVGVGTGDSVEITDFV